MDRVDLQILAILQEDASTTVAQISSRIGLSQSPCWKRIQKLEANGILLKRVALVSPAKVGLGLSVYISITTGNAAPEALDGFIRTVSAMPEVVEFSRATGDIDFMLRIAVADVEAYDAFYERLTGIIPLRKVSPHFVLQRIKSTTALPIAIGQNGASATIAGVSNKLPRRSVAEI